LAVNQFIIGNALIFCPLDMPFQANGGVKASRVGHGSGQNNGLKSEDREKASAGNFICWKAKYA
jgi:hypothetical protein